MRRNQSKDQNIMADTEEMAQTDLDDEHDQYDDYNMMEENVNERSKLLVDESDGLLDDYREDPKDREWRNNATTYEDALYACGFGKFSLLVLLLCGWAVSSDAIEVLSISFLLPSATCDLDMSSGDKGVLNSMVFFGMMIGGYFWGALADKWGRRNILMWSLLVNGIGNLGSSVAQVYWLFLCCRLVSGIGVGGSMPVVFTYFTEFQHKDKRGAMISLLATFWMTGNVIAGGLAWVIIPREYLSYSSSDFTFHSWRVFVALCTIPSLTSSAMFVLMPESAKFLLQMGREDEAIAVLKRMHASNKSTPLKLDHLILTDEVTRAEEESPIVEEGHKVRDTLCKIFDSTVHLFGKRLARTTWILLSANFTLAFGYYGLFLWFPELFDRMDKYGGTFCDVGTGNDTSNSSRCDTPSENVYVEGFLTSISNLPGNILTIFLVERIGRKILLASSMVLSGISVFFLWFVKTRWENVLMSCIFGAISVCGFNMLDILMTELYPTEVRSTAFGVQTGAMRIGAILGNIIFGELVDTYCIVPMLLVSGLLTFGGLLSLLLPNTVRIDIH